MASYNFKNVLDAVPNDHCKQVSVADFVKEVLEKNNKLSSVVDLGCGVGKFADFFSQYKNMKYTGIDIADSPEVRARKRSDIAFLTFDGVNLPFDDKSIDIIFMNQVLEHVRLPHLLFPEIYRCLSDQGVLVGSVSQLEPYHSHSILNYTFYGICSYLDVFGLNIFMLRPGVDAITVINRSFNKFILQRGFDFENYFYENESPLNYSIEIALANKTIQEVNLAKLRVSGIFCFAGKKIK